LVAVTGYARETDRAEALAAGFDMHFAKPIDLTTTVQAAVALLRERSGSS
jgi:CheY-like chemotaxis protein